MRTVPVAVTAVAGLAAVLTRWPSLVAGVFATLLAALWTFSVLRAERDGRFHAVGPAAAVLLLAVPVAPDALVPLPGVLVGLLVGAALLLALPERPAGLDARRGLAAWSPTLFVGILLLAPLLVLGAVGPARLTAAADRLGPAGLVVAALAVVAVVVGTVLVTHLEAPA